MKSFNIIVTAGGTSEPIDDVRRIANTGTGRLGSLIADELAKLDIPVNIFYVCAKESFRPESEKVHCIEILSVADLKAAVTELMQKYEIHGVIHSMAVSDYTVRSVSTVEELASFLQNSMNDTDDVQERILQSMDRCDIRKGNTKLSSQMKSPLLLLEQTPKILPIFREMAPKAVIVGFKLLSNVSVEELLDTAYRLLEKNNCDYVLANDASEIDARRHRGYLIDARQNIRTYNTKEEIAEGIAYMMKEELENR